MALDDTFLEKFRTDARSAKTLGKRDAWVIAVGGALSAGLIFFVQGEPASAPSRPLSPSCHSRGPSRLTYADIQH